MIDPQIRATIIENIIKMAVGGVFWWCIYEVVLLLCPQLRHKRR